MKKIDEFIQTITARLSKIDGVLAIALGGSRARGEARPDSDIDLGLYYDHHHPPSLQQLNQLATELDDRHSSDLLTLFGEWGKWINGGGWLRINNQPVDWLYRDVALVSKVISDCQAGETHCYYYPGHPHGFHDHYYLADIYYCRPLYDPNEVLSSFKEQVKSYSPLLKKRIIEKYLWEASFTLQSATKTVKHPDVIYVTGCLYRCVACLIQVLFALNERYINNEKGAMRVVRSFALQPADFTKTAPALLANPGEDENSLLTTIGELELIIKDVKRLADF